ncbi:xin actin-binding repeat-containing protein 1-like isoform X3 [Silurus asotus]|uniref:Xin actin-binding repeat-containing protein 1-like isoform X3 n=1 Tax=Silurus asotus TaxID=30991 RepID=A0AAD5AI41_SILAS|nr:xin actin-binding repeat-containing protein 1-like isoform X3 [Silurus asotus]
MHRKPLLCIAPNALTHDSSLTKILQFAAIPITGNETKLDTLIQRSVTEKTSAWADWGSNSHLTRSKSMEFLPHQRTISTSALRELFESKVVLQPKSVHKPKDTDKPQSTPVMENGGIAYKGTEDLLVFSEAGSINTDNNKKSAESTKEKEDNVTPKMADVTPKDFKETPYPEDDLAQLDPLLQPNSRDDSQSPIPTPNSKEVISTLYEQRQKCELRRLLKHTCPELKGLGNVVEEEFADILNSSTGTDIAYQGEVQSMRWIFENGTVSAGDSHKQPNFMEKNVQGEQTFEDPLNCTKQETIYPDVDESPQKVGETREEEENFRVNVKAKRKMFEGQLIETSREDLDDVFPGRIVISEDEKGTVQKQKKDFETYPTDTIKRNSDLSIIDVTDIDQDCGEVYQGISRAKELFEKGLDNENGSPPNENLSIEDEALKANVKNRTHMFESTPLDKINWQNDAESDTKDENMNKSLTSLYGFNVVHSHGALFEASEAGNVRKANYSFIQEKGAEIQHEEVVMGSMKSMLLQHLARVNLNPVIVFLREDDQGNVDIKKIDIPTHQLPFTVNQDKEYRTTNMVQVIEDLLDQETCSGKGVLIQEQAAGSVETLVYILFRHESHDGIVMDQNYENMLKTGEIDLPGNCNTLPKMCSPPPFTLEDAISHAESRISKVKLFQSHIENGDQGSLKSLQKGPSGDDTSFTTKQEEQKVEIAPGNFKITKAILVTNPEHDISSAQNEFKSNLEIGANDAEFVKCTAESVEPGRWFYNRDEKDMHEKKTDEYIVTLPVVAKDKMVQDDALSNLQAAIVSLQRATLEAKALQESVYEKHHDTNSASSENQCQPEGINKEGKKSLQNFEVEEGREETLKGSVQAALESLKKSSFNVTKGDFKDAMIYRNAGRTDSRQKTTTKMETDVKQSGDMVVPKEKLKACEPFPMPRQVTVETQHEGVKTRPLEDQPLNKPLACSPLTNQTIEQASLQKKTKPPGPKPLIPPKPDHLKTTHNSNTVGINSATNAGDLIKTRPELTFANLKPLQEDAVLKEPQTTIDADILSGRIVTEITTCSPEGNVAEEEKPNPLIEVSSGLQTSLQNFGIKTGQAMPPVKPKRIKMTTKNVPTPVCLEPGFVKEQPESNVIMREKKGRKKESDTERRQRLSVHMDEIMKGNVNAAMEIFDKLRKQEELKTILSKVEEIEGEASQEDDGLRKIFESVPDWVVPQKHVNPENSVMEKEVGRSGTVCDSEMLSSMQVAFGDLEKASAAIISLKEQTLSRLMEIEETIKKALYSVSTLKSDSDIVGLSGLFKESLMAGQYLPISGNIRKISIGSSKSSNPQSLNHVRAPQKSATTEPGMQKAEKSELSPPETKPRAGSPSSPSFISIQSSARKNPETSPKSQTAVTALTCYNIPAEKEKRQVSTLEVQTAPKAETVIGTKTIREKYEETDCFGNKFYSSTTSTVMTTQPDNKTGFRRQILTNPTTSDVVANPSINTLT